MKKAFFQINGQEADLVTVICLQGISAKTCVFRSDEKRWKSSDTRIKTIYFLRDHIGMTDNEKR